MKLVFLLWVMLFLLGVIIFSPIQAEENHHSNFSLALHIGINKPQAELKTGDFDEVFLREDFSQGYALSNTGYGFGLKAVYDPGNLPFSLIASISSNRFSNSKTITYRLVPDLPESKTVLSLNGQIVELSAGIQYLLFSAFKLKPFIGAGAAVNFFSGESNYDRKIENSTRTGILFLGGFQYNISTKVFGEIYTGYHWANLFGKGYQTSVQYSAELPLNDGKNPNDTSDIDRKINFLNFNLGIGLRI